MSIQREQYTEVKTKNRAWVKNAAIVFLTALLVLTFFSNSFMNYTLSEVAAQYPSYSGIQTQIRGQGIVEANQTTSVKMIGNRAVKSVQVKDGDLIEEGQVLFIFEGTEDSGLKTLEDELYKAERDYNLFLLQLENSPTAKSYSAKRDEIKEAEATLAEQKAALSKLTTDQYILRDPAVAKESAQDQVDSLKEQIESVGKQITELKTGLKETSAITEKRKAYESAWQSLERLVQDYIIADEKSDYNWYSRKINGHLAELERREKVYLSGQMLDETKPYDPVAAAAEIAKIRAIMDSTRAYDEAYLAYQIEIGGSEEQKGLASSIEALEDIVSGLESQQKQAEKLVTLAGKVVDQQKDIKTTEKSVSDKKKELAELKNDVEYADAKNGYDIAEKENAIEDIKADIENLKGNSGESEYKAKVGGIIKNITVVAGDDAKDAAVLATIEVIEKGYMTKFTVTIQQAAQVRVGDAVSIENVWWSNISATVSAIKTDPANPSASRIIECAVTGDASAGQTLELAVGQRSSNYSSVLPNSAIREDNNGKFILYIEAKSSPLGNRYFARRLDISVIASDDNHSAVSGLLGSEFVITTSTKPIEAGMQVRLPD